MSTSHEDSKGGAVPCRISRALRKARTGARGGPRRPTFLNLDEEGVARQEVRVTLTKTKPRRLRRGFDQNWAAVAAAGRAAERAAGAEAAQEEVVAESADPAELP